MHIKAAFSQTAADAMQTLVWDFLDKRNNINKNDPTSWPKNVILKLQELKTEAAFQAIGSDITISVINDLLGEDRWKKPKDWGQFLVTFPETDTWTIPSDWHTDFDFSPYTEPLSGLLLFSYFDDVAPQGGGTVAVRGSHRVIAQFMKNRPDLTQAKMKKRRLALLASDPWFEALSSNEPMPDRIAQFMHEDHLMNDIPVRVAELTGQAGDIVVAHPLLLHSRAFNSSDWPRFMCVQRIRGEK